VSRVIWKIVETKAGEAQVVETKGKREKERRGKNKKRENRKRRKKKNKLYRKKTIEVKKVAEK